MKRVNVSLGHRSLLKVTIVSQLTHPDERRLNNIKNKSTFTLAVGWVGGRPVMVGVVGAVEKEWGKLFIRCVCGGVERRESGVSGVGGEYTDWDTAGT